MCAVVGVMIENFDNIKMQHGTNMNITVAYIFREDQPRSLVVRVSEYEL